MFCLSVSYTFSMSAHLAVPVSGCPFTTIPSPTFITSCLRKRLSVHLMRIKHCCSFLITKPEEGCLFRNTHQFQGLDLVCTHVTHGGNNYQSCIVAGIKNLHQEMNKHLILSASANQIVSYWLLPPVT